jgi:hypothetical protein
MFDLCNPVCKSFLIFFRFTQTDPPSKDLIAYWRFNATDAGGNLIDLTGHGCTAVAARASLFVQESAVRNK